ncbi:MAG: diguanylate cyclase, partial [Wenzhouxiangella sp.]|nr:diguanylate cyclase [Wenzhouxiangella sp.]
MKLTGSYALKVALIYAAAGALWIFFSDSAVEQLAGDTALLTTFQTYKGWLFVLASAVLVFWLSWRALGDQEGLIRELRQTAVVFERTHEGVVLTDQRKRIVSVNPAFERMAGLSQDRLVGRDLAGLHSARHDDRFFAELERSVANRGYWNGEIWNRSADGAERPFLATVTDIGVDRDGNEQYAWIFTDISELKQAQKRLEHLAYYDPLTGLPNRLHLQDQLRRLLAVGRRGEERIAVLFIDLDNFRNVNDSFGHPIGDDLLVMVARRLRGGLPVGAGLAHMGGDEFVIHLSGPDARDGAAACARRTLEAIAEPFVL